MVLEGDAGVRAAASIPSALQGLSGSSRPNSSVLMASNAVGKQHLGATLEGAVKTGPFLARAQPLKIGLFTSLIALFL